MTITIHLNEGGSIVNHGSGMTIEEVGLFLQNVWVQYPNAVKITIEIPKSPNPKTS